MQLSPRKTEVLLAVTEGKTNKEIAAQCGISRDTAKIHVRDLLKIADVDNRTKLAVWAVTHDVLKGE